MLNSLEPDRLFGVVRQNSQSICLPSPSDYAATGSCKQYFANVGKANLDLLQRESSERKRLLLEALACLVCGQGTTLLKAGESLGMSAIRRSKNVPVRWYPVLLNLSVLCYFRKFQAHK